VRSSRLRDVTLSFRRAPSPNRMRTFSIALMNGHVNNPSHIAFREMSRDGPEFSDATD
jgi:hypothetical protein